MSLPSPRPGPVERALRDAQHGALARRFFSVRGFLTTLKLRRRFDLRPLQDERIGEGPSKVPDCAACTARCCAQPQNEVSLRLIDIARLLDGGHAAGIDRDRARRLAETMAAPPDSLTRFPMLRNKPDGSCWFYDAQTGSCPRRLP